MSFSSPDMRPPAPFVLPWKQWQFDLFWGTITLFSAVLTVALVTTSKTGGGRIAGGLTCGAMTVACVLGWADVRRHPAQLEVTPEAITHRYKGRAPTSLFKAAGADVSFVLVRMARGAHWALGQPGSTARVDVQHFDRQDLLRACYACGWRVHNVPGRRR